MTFIPELIIPRHERILSSPKLDNSFEIVNARDEPRNDASPLFLPAPPLVVPIRWNSTLPLAFTSTLVFYRPNKAEQTTTQTRRTTTARAKRTGGIGYAVIDTRDHRTLRGRKRCAPPPPHPLPPSPVDELAALSWNRWRLLALFFTGFTCTIPRTRNTILLYSGWWIGAGFTCWTVSRRWFFKTNERLLRIEVRLVDYRGQRQEENRKTLSRESRWTYMKNL